MWFPKLTRHTLSFAGGDAGGEKVLTFRRGDDFEIAYNITVFSIAAGRNIRRNWCPYLMVIAFSVTWGMLGIILTLAITGAAAAALAGWRLGWPTSYETHISSDWRAWWRHRRIYRKPWQSAMENRGLAMMYGEVEHLPAIRKVISGPYTDQLLVEKLNGQPIEEFEKATSGLGSTFGAQRCRVREDPQNRRCVWLDFTHSDALSATVPALPVPDDPDLAALDIGRTEFGSPWPVQLLGSHVFVAGLTGAGKGSVVWSLIRAMGPLIANRTVRLWVIDPKGGMELGIGENLFYRFATDLDDAQKLLAEAVQVMQERAVRLRAAGRRLHEPTPDDPFDVVVIDELANLTAYDKADPARSKQTVALIQLLLSQGRAPGICVVAAVQDPRIEVVSFRQLFPITVALRLKDEHQVKTVLGEGARARGAECDKIGPSQQGVGYVLLEGVREPQRVRAAYVSDADVKAMVERFAPQPRLQAVA